MPLPKIYCLTCQETPERHAAARERFAADGMAVEFVRGVHGRTWHLAIAEPNCTHAYLITRASARKLMDLCGAAETQVDYQLRRALPQLQHFVAHQPLLGQLTMEGKLPCSLW